MCLHWLKLISGVEFKHVAFIWNDFTATRPVCLYKLVSLQPSSILAHSSITSNRHRYSSVEMSSVSLWPIGAIIITMASSVITMTYTLHIARLHFWSRTPHAPSFAPPTPKSSLFREQTLDLATGVSLSRVREFGTVCPPHCGSLTLNLDTLNDFSNAFLFGETAAH